MKITVRRTELGLAPADKQALITMFLCGDSSADICQDLAIHRATFDAVMREAIKGLLAIVVESGREAPDLVTLKEH